MLENPNYLSNIVYCTAQSILLTYLPSIFSWLSIPSLDTLCTKADRGDISPTPKLTLPVVAPKKWVGVSNTVIELKPHLDNNLLVVTLRDYILTLTLIAAISISESLELINSPLHSRQPVIGQQPQHNIKLPLRGTLQPPHPIQPSQKQEEIPHDR